MVDQGLTPDERRGLAIAALHALIGGIVGGLVAWGFEEAKRLANERRERKAKPPEPPMVVLK
jgi:uncharacterized membrane protein YagU involved in acid resistance